MQLSVDIFPFLNGGCATANIATITMKKGVLKMNMSDRIQYLRKTKGISQEELAVTDKEQKSKRLRKILYISSTAFVAIELQTMGGMNYKQWKLLQVQ